MKYALVQKDRAFKLSGSNIDYVIKGIYKPILLPLSDLTKEIECDGFMFTYKEILEDMYGDITRITDTMQVGSFVPYGIIKKLFEWHFDVFDLIEKGLAIDINTLENGN